LDERFVFLRKEKFDPTRRSDYANISVHSDSWFLGYQFAFGLRSETLTGKSLLDIGGMPGGIFAKYAQSIGLNLTTLNPCASLFTEDVKQQSSCKSVLGFAQEMPFEDNSFDIILGLASVPVYLPNYESEYRRAFREIIRTLKPGGKAILTSIPESIYKDLVFVELVKKFKGVSNWSFEDLGEDEGDFYGEKVKMRLYKLIITKKR